ncbi:EF-hand domain-containing protein [Pseudooceanicola sp. MF1-13]|uniref:EF-hand domain-containing protein n=1 Tax=Pseudooceanicola sp. MF1-13 TaxID=3379095 RepID=UPI003891CC46
MKRALALSTAMIIGLTANALPVMAQDGPGPRGPRMDFATMDTNGDGQITQEELTASAAARFAEADTNGDGSLSVEEMVARMQARAEERQDDRLQRGAERMMNRMDQNDDGVLSADEMRPRNADRMFARLDADDNGSISEEELSQARERMGKRHEMGGKRHGGDHDHGHGQKRKLQD